MASGPGVSVRVPGPRLGGRGSLLPPNNRASAATAGMISVQRMLLNPVMPTKEAAGRGRLDPMVKQYDQLAICSGCPSLSFAIYISRTKK